MLRYRILDAFLFCVILCSTLLISNPAWAKQEMRLAELDPSKMELGVFNSYKHGIVLVSLVQIHKPSFNCLPNQYFLYNYKSESFFEILAANLKVSSGYTRMFRMRVHSLPGVPTENPQEKEKLLKMLSTALKIPTELISAAQQKSFNADRICWQQPELLDMQTKSLRTFPFLAANLCEKQWCSELYWTGPSHIRLWIHQKPKHFQLINLDVEKSTFSVKGQSARFVRSHIPQANAPRENLVNPQSLNGKVLVLKKARGGSVSLEWHKERSGRIVVSLMRTGADQKAAKKEQGRFLEQVNNGSSKEALQTAEFALWLDPHNQSIKIERLKIYASQSLINRFFDSLDKDFTSSERFSTCQKLHLEPSIRHHWKNDAFVTRFRKTCRQ